MFTSLCILDRGRRFLNEGAKSATIQIVEKYLELHTALYLI